MRLFKSISILMVVAVGLIFSLGTSAKAATLISNQGFETGLLGPWSADSGIPSVSGAEANTGAFSVAVLGGDSIRQNFSATATNLVTEVSIWVKRFGGAFNQYSFYYDDASVGTFLISDTGGSNDWKQFDLTSNLAASKNLTGFSIFGTSPGPAYLDDVVIDANLAPIPVPASLPLLFIGLGGLMAIRRRRKAIS